MIISFIFILFAFHFQVQEDAFMYFHDPADPQLIYDDDGQPTLPQFNYLMVFLGSLIGLAFLSEWLLPHGPQYVKNCMEIVGCCCVVLLCGRLLSPLFLFLSFVCVLCVDVIA